MLVVHVFNVPLDSVGADYVNDSPMRCMVCDAQQFAKVGIFNDGKRRLTCDHKPCQLLAPIVTGDFQSALSSMELAINDKVIQRATLQKFVPVIVMESL